MRHHPIEPILTHRQQEIVYWLEAGCTSAEIALQLEIAEDTVRNHIRNAMARLGASQGVEISTRAQLISVWVRLERRTA